MRIAYLDCFAGISGDMLLGALADAGVPHTVLQDAAAALDLGATLQFETVDRSGIAATKVHVLEDGRLAEQVTEASQEHHEFTPPAQSAPAKHVHPHVQPAPTQPEEAGHAQVHGRPLHVIRELIQGSALPDAVKQLATRTFELLGTAEARVHNVPVEEIHFHEVGAVDAIVDIVAAAAGLAWLGVDTWACSPVNVGGGTVRCTHGVFPVPAPATAELLRGVPTYSAHVQKELVTPTGAALLRALAPAFGPQPAMVTQAAGYGAGTRNPAGFANVLRLSFGEWYGSSGNTTKSDAHTQRHADASQHVTVLEAALDDATPQLLAYVTEQAFHHGALDVMLTPVIMKKGRPGTLLTVLSNPQRSPDLERFILRETTTLGLRIREDRRVCLQRAHQAVQTAYGPIRVKTGSSATEVLNAHPEFEDCRRAAEQHGVPLKRVQAAALAAYMNAVAEGTAE